jgi:hypothetical protein
MSQYHKLYTPGPFYGFNRPGVKASEAIIRNWWRQGMIEGAKAHYDGIVARTLNMRGRILGEIDLKWMSESRRDSFRLPQESVKHPQDR